MKDSFTQSVDWLHAWSGLLFGWLLFAIFLTGTLTVFDKEITYWMQPELHHAQLAPVDEAVGQQLTRLAPNATQWRISLPSARVPTVTIFWKGSGKDKFEQRKLDPATGEILEVRDTRGGDFFYRFHYSLYLNRTGVWILGASAMVMLVALVTGLVIHRVEGRIVRIYDLFRGPRSRPSMRLIALAWTYKGLLALSLAMPNHYRHVFAHAPTGITRYLLRAAGWLLLSGALATSITLNGWSFGPVEWIGMLGFCSAIALWFI